MSLKYAPKKKNAHLKQIRHLSKKTRYVAWVELHVTLN